MVTRPTESMTASSGLEVDAHARWVTGQPGMAGENTEQGVGSLRSHVPFSGWQRRKRRSMDRPSLEIEAIVPCLDQAMPLQERV